jgi:queuine tRNA-ribosyltransferase
MGVDVDDDEAEDGIGRRDAVHYRLTRVSEPAPSRFTISARSGGARRGRLRLPHGEVETPVFMPVGTQAAVKGVTLAQVAALEPDIILANTYHLHLRPGDELIGRAGGLHAFMGWPRPLLTDSGGFQVFSLAGRRTVNEDAVHFQSHLDGSACVLSPESAVDIQARLGSDIAMMFDECPSGTATREEAEAAMRRTLRWARRGRDRFLALQAGADPGVPRPTPGRLQLGFVRGGVHRDLR